MMIMMELMKFDIQEVFYRDIVMIMTMMIMTMMMTTMMTTMCERLKDQLAVIRLLYM